MARALTHQGTTPAVFPPPPLLMRVLLPLRPTALLRRGIRTNRAHRLALVAGVLLAPLPAAAQAYRVVGSPHDFSGGRRGPDGRVGFAEVCGTCHAEAGRLMSPDPREGPRYEMYESSTMDAPRPGQPSGTSLLCLSCHDGTLGGDVAVDGSVGIDLRNDHPVSIEYGSGDPSLRPAGEVRDAGLRLFGDDGEGQVECATCHDPHDNAYGNFLRRPNDGSRLCQSCHAK